MSQTFFTADTHFGHGNIIAYCDRPFANSVEMDEEIIHRWNLVVRPEDTVYHLGDFAFCLSHAGLKMYADRLNGRKFLIRGNHDIKPAGLAAAFDGMWKHHLLVIEGLRVNLSHIPRKPVSDAINLCGHIHNNWATNGPWINVGVDVRGFYPVTLSQILPTI